MAKRHGSRRQLMELLKREFPLMCSARLPFMTPELVIRIFEGELPECDGLHGNVEEYVAWMKSGYDPAKDPLKRRS